MHIYPFENYEELNNGSVGKKLFIETPVNTRWAASKKVLKEMAEITEGAGLQFKGYLIVRSTFAQIVISDHATFAHLLKNAHVTSFKGPYAQFFTLHVKHHEDD